jgi:hypothetical protein
MDVDKTVNDSQDDDSISEDDLDEVVGGIGPQAAGLIFGEAL